VRKGEKEGDEGKDRAGGVGGISGRKRKHGRNVIIETATKKERKKMKCERSEGADERERERERERVGKA